MSDKSVREAIALAYAKSVNPYSTRGNNFDQEQADWALAIISDAGYAVLPKEYEAKAKAFDAFLRLAEERGDAPEAELLALLVCKHDPSAVDKLQFDDGALKDQALQRISTLSWYFAKHSPKTDGGGE